MSIASLLPKVRIVKEEPDRKNLRGGGGGVSGTAQGRCTYEPATTVTACPRASYISVRVTIAVIKYHDQKDIGEERVYLVRTSTS